MSGIVIGNELKIFLHETARVKSITYNNDLVSGFITDPVDIPLSAIYLRVYKNGNVENVYDLMDDATCVTYSKNCISYIGEANGKRYSLDLRVKDSAWSYIVKFNGGKDYDVLYVQDVGVGDERFILNNELYSAHYLGFSQNVRCCGYEITATRNNGERHPFVKIGALIGYACGYSTDATQFFGNSFTVTETASKISAQLDNEIRQYEMPIIALCVKPKDDVVQVYGNYSYLGNDDKKIDDKTFDFLESMQKYEVSKSLLGKCIIPNKISKAQLNELYPSRILTEYENDELLSFFTNDYRHVATEYKERLVSRPHGNVILGGYNGANTSDVFCNTSLMFGCFLSQTCFGNVNYNRFLSPTRGIIDHAVSSGLRIYIFVDGKYHRLKAPSLFECGLNFTRYVYVTDFDEITVVVYSHFCGNGLSVTLTSKNNVNYDFLVSLLAVVGENEYHTPPKSIVRKNSITFTSTHPPCCLYAKDLRYVVSFDRDIKVLPASEFFSGDVSSRVTFISISGNKFSLTLGKQKTARRDFETEKNAFYSFYKHLLVDASITNHPLADKIYATLLWFCHDAIIHFYSPHGLEQTGGAAWGTRDVCQGPFELFCAVGRFDVARQILLKVFSFQNENGDWPQWFMPDDYPFVADDSHGDVIFWPLKALGEYINLTGDVSIMNETVSYSTCLNETISLHLLRAIQNIKSRTVNGLITFGGGDWNDALQPANPNVKQNLYSVWTTALCYETLLAVFPLIDEKQQKELSRYLNTVKRALNKDALSHGVPCGFILREKRSKKLLHPTDKTSGIKYRLLSLTRTVLADVYEKEQNLTNVKVAMLKLLHPDGVRLMDKPIKYSGTSPKLFLRAEQATNVGREIGLMYSHAHLRFVQACAKCGFANAVSWGLNVISPISIRRAVANAEVRQANCYFSSADANFNTREQFSKHFDKVKSGDVSSRGGWRIYSSGCGLYIARVIKDMLGITLTNKGIIFRPLISFLEVGLQFCFTVKNKKITVSYKAENGEFLLNGKVIPSQEKGVKQTFIAYDNLLDENLLEVVKR